VNLSPQFGKEYLMTLDAGSSNSYVKEHPFLLGLVEANPFLSIDYPVEVVPSYRFDLIRFFRQELLSYNLH
jgi:hypothetical protein